MWTSTRPELEAREDGGKCGLGNLLPERYWRGTGERFNSDPVKVYVILVVFFLLKATALTPSKYSDVKTLSLAEMFHFNWVYVYK